MGSARTRLVVGGLVAAALMLPGVGAVSGQTATEPPPVSVDADWHTLGTPPLADGQFELLTLSTLPDTVTGGDVLIAVRGLPADAPLEVAAEGRDVSGVMSSVAASERRGLITGLPEGPSTITATSGDAVPLPADGSRLPATGARSLIVLAAAGAVVGVALRIRRPLR